MCPTKVPKTKFSSDILARIELVDEKGDEKSLHETYLYLVLVV